MKLEYTQEAIANSKLEELIYNDYIKYYVDNRVFSYREYKEMVMRDPDQVDYLLQKRKRK